MTDTPSPNPQVTSSLSDSEVGSPTWIEACWHDMRTRASSGAAFDADRYISMIPNPSPQQTADLVYCEFLLSRDSGQDVTSEQFLQRYPDAAEQLARQFTIDDALSDVIDYGNDDEETNHDSDPNSQETLLEQSAPPEFLPEPLASASHTKIGRYVVVNELKHGAQAEVYRAYDPALRRDVVIKIEARQDSASHRLFSDSEAIITANLNHPNIAPALDAGDHQGRRFSVSRYIRGRTFDQWVSSSKPQPQVVAALLAKIARGLASAHEHGTLHLDVKPRNIVVDENQEPYLIDFGLSVVANAHQQDNIEEGVIRGTLQFMSPEQLLGDAERIGPCSDIFGLGATLFMGWVGRAPYDPPETRDDLLPIKRCQWRAELLDAAGFPEEMKAVVSRALAADPADRYQSCSEIATDLERIATSHHTGSSANQAESHRLTKFLPWAMAASIVVLLGAGLWAFRPESDPNIAPVVKSETESNRPLEISVGIEGDRFVDLAMRVPLRSGDKLRLQGYIPAEKAAVLSSFAPDGTVQNIARFDRQAAGREFHHPSDPSQGDSLGW